MFRVIRLILLGIVAYVISVVWLFPAAPVIDRIKPQIQPVQPVSYTHLTLPTIYSV